MKENSASTTDLKTSHEFSQFTSPPYNSMTLGLSGDSL